MRGQSIYVWIIAVLVFVPLMGISLSAVMFPGYTGVLTRIGGFSESDYGWNEPQEVFSEPLFVRTRNVAEYSRYYDVVVIGDSFSFDINKGWQNHFIERTGLSVITFHHDIPLISVLNSSTFKNQPPLLFIVESLEQFSLDRLAAYNSLQQSGSVQNTAVSERVISVAQHEYDKNKITNTSDAMLEVRIAQRRHNLEKTLKRYQQGSSHLETLKKLHGIGEEHEHEYFHDSYALPLRGNTRLFSNRLHDSILVYGLDILKSTAQVQISDAARGLEQIRLTIEGNGHSKFILMLFPDKLSVYAPWLADAAIAPPSLIPKLAQLYPQQVRLDVAFKQALSRPVIDLYLPNDTHAGSAGYRLAAETLIEYMLDAGMVRYN